MRQGEIFMNNKSFEDPSPVIVTHRVIMDAVPDLIFVLDRTGTILEANRTACDLLGYTGAEFGGRKFGSFIAGDFLANTSLDKEDYLKNEAGVRGLLWTRNNELLLVNVSITPQFNNRGDCVGLLVVAKTISEKNNKWDSVISKLIDSTQATLTIRKSNRANSKDNGTTETNRRDQMKRIMVVDDEEIIRKVVQDIVSINFRDITVDVVDSGEEALKRTQKRNYDLVFLDMKMKTVDGMETYRRMRELNPTQKVIIVTGYFDEEKNRIAMMAGICGTIYKPFTMEQITEAIERYVLTNPVTSEA